MFSDITELEQEIAQFKDNLQNSGAICDNLQKVHQYLIELSKDLSDTSASLLQSLETSRRVCRFKRLHFRTTPLQCGCGQGRFI